MVIEYYGLHDCIENNVKFIIFIKKKNLIYFKIFLLKNKKTLFFQDVEKREKPVVCLFS